MKNVKEALEIVETIDEKYNQTGAIKQFTIDMIEHFVEELNGCILGETELSEETILGSLSYKANTALEICDDEITDFYVLQELYDAVND
jgi:hypothetical protein